MMIDLPCKIGDTMWGIRRYQGVHIAQKGTVSQIYLTDDMLPVIVLKGVCRGLYGVKIFATKEDAENKILGG